MAIYELADDQRDALLTIINIAVVNPVHGGMAIAEAAVALSKILKSPVQPADEPQAPKRATK